jgi:hypothetical protein
MMDHHQRQNAIRGGFAIGMVALAAGGVICNLLGWSYTTEAQWMIGTIGVLAGGIIGTRELHER